MITDKKTNNYIKNYIMKNTELKNWEIDVRNYLKSINEELQNDDEAKKLYFGFEVIDGQLKLNPEILFIGINPGSGSGIHHYDIKFSSERISYLDFFENEYPYPLAKDTISLLSQVGLTKEEIIAKLKNNCVKTNLYHIITSNENEIRFCLNKTQGKFKEYYKNCISTCMSLISILSPRIVVFEGKSAYDAILIDCYGIEDSWDKELNFGYYFSESENIHLIGYSRLYSNIKAKEHIADKIKSIGLLPT